MKERYVPMRMVSPYAKFEEWVRDYCEEDTEGWGLEEAIEFLTGCSYLNALVLVVE